MRTTWGPSHMCWRHESFTECESRVPRVLLRSLICYRSELGSHLYSVALKPSIRTVLSLDLLTVLYKTSSTLSYGLFGFLDCHRRGVSYITNLTVFLSHFCLISLWFLRFFRWISSMTTESTTKPRDRCKLRLVRCITNTAQRKKL